MLRFRLVLCAALLCSSPYLFGQQYIASTIAGPGTATIATNALSTTLTKSYGDGGTAINGILTAPVGVAYVNGNLFILENGGQRIRQVTNGTISTAGGSGGYGYFGDGAVASLASFSYPQGFVVDASANIYVADTNAFVIRKFQVGGNISTYAGTGFSGFGADGVAANKSQLLLPHAVALDSAGNLFVADGNRIRKITPSGAAITTIAGGFNAGFAGDGGPAAAAQFNSPQGIAVDAAGNIFVADTFNQRVRKITAAGIITTIAGGGASVGDGGQATNAQLLAPTGIAMDATGAVYITEHNRVRKVFPNGVITTIAGTGTDGYSGDGGLGTGAQLTTAYGITLDPQGNVYVADSGNNVVREFSPAASAAITNSASNLQNGIAPGEIVTIFGTGLGPDPLTNAAVDKTANLFGLFDTTLNGVQVKFDGFPAPIIYVSGKQIAAIVPYEVANTGSGVAIQVINSGVTTAAFTTSLVAAEPEIFTSNSTGSGNAAALNQNGSLNSPSNPASGGQAVVLYVTGEGVTSPGGVDGQINNGSTLPKPLLPVTATVSGIAVPVEYAGAAPGLVAGVMQVNIRLPLTGLTGSVPVRVTVGGATSTGPVFIAVK